MATLETLKCHLYSINDSADTYMSLLSELILMYVKFRVIQRKYGNISANGKFCGSARNSVARRKVWSLFVIAYLSSCGYVYLNVAVGEAA